MSFLRDVQPVLDRHCVRCHEGLRPAGNLDFHGGLTSHDAAVPGYGFNRAYESIMENGLVSVSKVRDQDASITPPLAYGAANSKLIQVLVKVPHSEEVRLTDDERLRLHIWIDANAPYHDGFVNKRPSRPAYDLAADQELQTRITLVHQQRCGSCHDPLEISRLDWIDVRQPERSLFLAASLATVGQSTPKCPGRVYEGAGDCDYQAVRELVTDAVRRAWEAPRRDLRTLPAPEVN